MTEAQYCTDCSLELTDENVDGLCPGCLLRTSLETANDETISPSKKDQPAPASADDATLAPGKQQTHLEGTGSHFPKSIRDMGDYELVNEIARGGMGVVYRARQKSLNREVAVKMILSGSLASEEDRVRFQTEAEAAARLDHPGIVPIYEVGHETSPQGEQFYYSMALIHGQSLADRIAEQPFDNRSAAELMIEIGNAVEYAHQRGIIHRDLKPANILLDEKGRPRITDFGLAKNVDGDSQLTATGQVMGTPSYMPPEQVSGKSEAIGPAADVYALGAILYCMLTGKPPFQCETLLETLTQVLDREPEPLSQFSHEIDINLETICLKCLEKSPDKRFASVQELIDELIRFTNEEPILSRRMSAWERIGRWRQMVKRNPDVRIQSKTKWFGIPLVSIACGQDRAKGEKTGKAVGIFAFGDKSIGVVAIGRKSYGILAYGLHSRGVVSIGFTSIGVVSAGFFSFGLLATGAIAIGYQAFGCLAIGYTAVGLVVVGYKVAGAFGWMLGK